MMRHGERGATQWDPAVPIVGAESRLAELCGGLASLRKYPKRVFVYQQGEVSHHFYQLVSGRIRIFNGQADGREQVLALVEPGGLFGEAACFDGVPYYTSAVTLKPSAVRVFSRETVLDAMRDDPEILLEVLRSVIRKQRLFALQLETMMFRKAPARVALILARLATYYGAPAALGSGTRIGLHLSHEALAAMIGLTRVTVTREIGALIRDGIITRDKRHLVVLHQEQLLARAQLVTPLLTGAPTHPRTFTVGRSPAANL
jgi:CRP/FNR family cyclic AMP-dependent transcriptional regulator